MVQTSMNIAVLSGKGGTGKTLLSVNMAAASESATYIDCDVEEPNGYLFFKPEEIVEENVSVKIPEVDKELCSGCRKCVDFCKEIVEENVSVKIPEVNKELCSGCRKCVDFCKFCKFNALAFIKKVPIVFGDICHSCGGCSLLCPENAITEKDKVIGKIEKGKSQGIDVYTGILNTGEVSGVPIIEKLLEENRATDNEKLSIIDCRPASECILMESIIHADFCVFFADPKAYGDHY